MLILKDERRHGDTIYVSKARFPILVDIDGYLIGAGSGQSLLKKLSHLDLKDNVFTMPSTVVVKGGAFMHLGASFQKPLYRKRPWAKIDNCLSG